jgi:hypothetical protein
VVFFLQEDGLIVISLFLSFRRSSLQIFLLTSALLLTTTVLLSGGLYDSREELYYNKLHRQSVQAPERLIGEGEFDTAPLLAQSTGAPAPSPPSHSLLALSAVGFLGSYGEGAMVTWSVIYYQRYINVPNSLNGIGFFSFMICMAVGRFTCDFLRKTFGRRKLIGLSGVLAGVGVCLLIAAPSLTEQISQILICEVGISLTGLGLSTIVPTVFSSAGHLPGTTHAGTSIATVAAFTYCGSIVAPPLVGGISQALQSLR